MIIGFVNAPCFSSYAGLQRDQLREYMTLMITGANMYVLRFRVLELNNWLL